MKKIWPSTQDDLAQMQPINCKPITQQQYEDLVERTNCAECKADIASDKVDALREDMDTAIGTGVLTADTGTITSLQSDNIEATTIVGCDITSDKVCASTCVDTAVVKASNVNSLCFSGTNATLSGTLASNAVEANSLEVTNATISCLTTDNFSPEHISTCDITANEVNATSATLTCAEIGTLNADEGSITCLTSCEIDTDEATVNSLKSTVSDLEFITHKANAQLIDNTGEDGDYYIRLPLFTNGFYYLEAGNDGGTKLWSVEIANSLKNVQFRWSEVELGTIIDVKLLTDASGITIVQVHANTLNEHVTLYHQSQSTSNTSAPTIYSTDTIPEPEYEFIVDQRAGTWIQDIIFTNRLHVDCLEMDQLNMDCVGIYRKLFLTCDFNQEGGILEPIPVSGTEGQYVSNKVICDQVTPSWTDPASRVDSCETALAKASTVASYDGIDYQGTYECDPEDQVKCYPIAHLNENTTVHGDITVECNAVICDSLSVTCASDSVKFNDSNLTKTETTNTLTNVHLDESDPTVKVTGAWSRYTTDGTNERRDELAVLNSDCTLVNAKPIVYNCEANALETSDSLEIEDLEVDNLQVNCDANVNGDLHVGGDMRVDGTLYTVDEESITSSSDLLTLRANKNASLGNDYSGILVNKYNGLSSLALVTDSDGTLRVGDGVPSNTTYAQLYQDLSDNKYYTDEELTVEVSPQGTMTAWDTYEKTDTYKHWTNAVWSVINFSTLQPLLTRDEAINLTDLGLFKWNAATSCADTITVPSECGASLKYNTTTCSYYWEKSAGNYIFPTMACYTAVEETIPVGSLINIEDEKNYVNAEEQA
jgi:hypothetical protein